MKEKAKETHNTNKQSKTTNKETTTKKRTRGCATPGLNGSVGREAVRGKSGARARDSLCAFIPLRVSRRIKRSPFSSRFPKNRPQSPGTQQIVLCPSQPPDTAPGAALWEQLWAQPCCARVLPPRSCSSSGFPRKVPVGAQVSFSLHPSSDKRCTAHDTHLMQNSRTRMRYGMLMGGQSRSPGAHTAHKWFLLDREEPLGSWGESHVPTAMEGGELPPARRHLPAEPAASASSLHAAAIHRQRKSSQC